MRQCELQTRVYSFCRIRKFGRTNGWFLYITFCCSKIKYFANQHLIMQSNWICKISNRFITNKVITIVYKIIQIKPCHLFMLKMHGFCFIFLHSFVCKQRDARIHQKKTTQLYFALGVNITKGVSDLRT